MFSGTPRWRRGKATGKACIGQDEAEKQSKNENDVLLGRTFAQRTWYPTGTLHLTPPCCWPPSATTRALALRTGRNAGGSPRHSSGVELCSDSTTRIPSHLLRLRGGCVQSATLIVGGVPSHSAWAAFAFIVECLARPCTLLGACLLYYLDGVWMCLGLLARSCVGACLVGTALLYFLFCLFPLDILF